jgi:hypothetical protein
MSAERPNVSYTGREVWYPCFCGRHAPILPDGAVRWRGWRLARAIALFIASGRGAMPVRERRLRAIRRGAPVMSASERRYRRSRRGGAQRMRLRAHVRARCERRRERQPWFGGRARARRGTATMVWCGSPARAGTATIVSRAALCNTRNSNHGSVRKSRAMTHGECGFVRMPGAREDSLARGVNRNHGLADGPARGAEQQPWFGASPCTSEDSNHGSAVRT